MMVVYRGVFDTAQFEWNKAEKWEEKTDWRIFLAFVDAKRMNEDKENEWLSLVLSIRMKGESEIDRYLTADCWRRKQRQVWEEFFDHFDQWRSIEKDPDEKQLTIDRRDIHIFLHNIEEDKNKQ
jgi:hypothetical protein